MVRWLSETDSYTALYSFQLQGAMKSTTSTLFGLPKNKLYSSQPAKLDLNKKFFPKQKTIQNFIIDAQGFRKTKNENPPTWEMGVTS